MIGKTDRRFWKSFEKLPVPAQNLAREKYALWKSDPYHPRSILKSAAMASVLFVSENITVR